jgi:CPA2 family monovalent cation:H+ antiporter-2
MHSLYQVVALIGVAFAATALADRLRIPPALLLLLCGAALGPAGIGLLGGTETIAVVAELGVVLLLFVLGLEFSLRKLWQLRRLALWAGIPQMLFSALWGMALWYFLAPTTVLEALGIGIIFAVSSTAIGVRLLADTGDLGTPHGRLAVSVLLAQDVAIAPIVVLVRFLGILAQEQEALSLAAIAREMLLTIAAVIGLWAGLWFLVRFLVYLLRLTSSREALVLLGMTIGIGSALASASLGLSPALGAFLAGVLFSEYQERYRLQSVVEPFRDALASFFFLSVGLSLPPSLPAGPVVAGALLLFLGKLLTAALPALFMGFPLRSSILGGLLLASLGEFSLLGLLVGAEAGLFSPAVQHRVQGMLIVSMLASAVAYPLLRSWLHRVPIPVQKPTQEEGVFRDHVVLIGYGVTGQTLHTVLKETGTPYAILELNPFTVALLRSQGEPAIVGDCTNEQSLRRVGVERARAVVVAISDSFIVPRAVGLIRTLNPTAFIVVRTRFVAHIEPLRAAGASAVVAEEFEASLHLLALLLRHLGMSSEAIAALQERFRAQHYVLLRQQFRES